MALPIYQVQSFSKVRKLFCGIRSFVRSVLMLEPEKHLGDPCIWVHIRV